MKNGPDNTKIHDNGAKLIFDDPILCAQFLRGYTDMCIIDVYKRQRYGRVKGLA